MDLTPSDVYKMNKDKRRSAVSRLVMKGNLYEYIEIFFYFFANMNANVVFSKYTYASNDR